MVRFYIIKDQNSGNYIHNDFERSRGFTQDDLAPAGSGMRPRLFHTIGAARSALKWWQAGRTSVSVVGSWEFGDCDESWHTEPVEERKAYQMAVFPLELNI